VLALLAHMHRLLIAVALGLLACGRAPLSTTPSGHQWQPELLAACPAQDARDFVGVSGVSVSGDALTLTVTHSGGCKTHEYGLCWNQTFLESQPVQAQLRVLHEDNGDSCEAIVTNTLTFDLADLKAAYRSGYASQTGTVILRLGAQSTRYEF
jgi:hypothetical protein